MIVRIELTPDNDYFFGSTKRSNLGNKKNYNTNSFKIPPQLTILGMLRNQLLLQNRMMGSKDIRIPSQNFEKAMELIGSSQFPDANDYGKIQSISPVLLMDGKGRSFRVDRYSDIKVSKQKGGTATSLLEWETEDTAINEWKAWDVLCKDKPYSAKNAFPERLISMDGGNAEPLENVITSYQSAHNHKAAASLDNTEGYYIMTRYRLKQDWKFVVWVDMKDEPLRFGEQAQDGQVGKYHLFENFVCLGGERSRFRMKVAYDANTDGSYSNYFGSSAASDFNRKRIVLLSDTYVQSDYHLKCDLVFAETKENAYIRRDFKKNASKYASPLKADGEKGISLQQHHLILKAGSLLYPKDGIGIDDLFVNQQACQMVGFNHFILEKI